MNPTRDAQINYLNIGLMIISAIAAYILPFEVFLFAYAFLGPLHYLTEISWLHDRQYFAKGKYDFVPLLLVGVVLSYAALANDFEFNSDFLKSYQEMSLGDILLCLALFSSILFAFVKNLYIKIATIGFLFIFIYKYFNGENDTDNFAVFTITSLVPTLIHVYLFTGLFMLYGALKSRSKSGLLSVAVFAIVPILLMKVLPDSQVMPISDYGKAAYYADGGGFFNTNAVILKEFGYDTTSERKLNMKNYTVTNIISGFSDEFKETSNANQINVYKDSISRIPNEYFLFTDKKNPNYKKPVDIKDYYGLIMNEPMVKLAVTSSYLNDKILNNRLNEISNKDEKANAELKKSA